MSEQVVETPEVIPVETLAPVEAAPEVEEPEKIYEYQPTDEHGHVLGGKQVLKYRTPDELARKLTDQNILLVRKLRETTKKQRLGITDAEEIPEDAPRFDAPLDFAPRELSADERIQLSRDMLDPERNIEASNRMVEAALGVKPELLRRKLSEMESTNMRLQAMIEGEAFVRNTPDYYPCIDNFKTITSWMLKNDLAPVRGNFKIAFDNLKAAGVLLEANVPVQAAPAVEPAPVPTAPTVPAEPVEPAALPVEVKPAARIPTGLTRSQATESEGAPRSVGEDIVYDQPIVERGKIVGHKRYTGLAAIDRMPADEFKRRANSDKSFNQKYERLLQESEQKRSQR